MAWLKILTLEVFMIVNEIMTRDVITGEENQTVEQAAKIMASKNISSLPVTNNQKELVGILTESDFVGKEKKIPHALASIKQLFGQLFYFEDVEEIYKKAKKRKLSEVMTKSPTTVTPTSTLTDVVNIMISKGFKRLPVIENKKLVGIVARRDILKAFVSL